MVEFPIYREEVEKNGMNTILKIKTFLRLIIMMTNGIKLI